MMTSLVKFAAPLVLFFALVFLAGAVSLAADLAGGSRADLCCQQAGGEAPSSPAEGECAETECRCFSCSVPLVFENSLELTVSDSFLSFWDRQPFLPPEPDRSIDYPPERA